MEARLDPSHKTKYPHKFHNWEKLPLDLKEPFYIYPVFATTTWRESGRKHAGPARVVFSMDANSKFYVLYHDPQQEKTNASRNHAFSKAGGKFPKRTKRIQSADGWANKPVWENILQT